MDIWITKTFVVTTQAALRLNGGGCGEAAEPPEWLPSLWNRSVG